MGSQAFGMCGDSFSCRHRVIVLGPILAHFGDVPAICSPLCFRWQLVDIDHVDNLVGIRVRPGQFRAHGLG